MNTVDENLQNNNKNWSKISQSFDKSPKTAYDLGEK